MRKTIIVLMVAAVVFMLVSCGLTQYRKFEATQIPLPKNLNVAFENTTTEQIEWYLAASKDWHFAKTRENVMASRCIPEETYEPYVRITVFTQGFFDAGAKYEITRIVDSTSETIDIDVYKTRLGGKRGDGV